MLGYQKNISAVKGDTWGKIKNDAITKISFKEGYELAAWKLNDANGKALTDTDVFTKDTIVFVTSQSKYVTISLKGDSNVTFSSASLSADRGASFKTVKEKITGVTFKEGYQLAGWKLNDASGNDLKDTDTFEADTTIFAVSKKVITVTLTGDGKINFSQTSISVFKGSTWAEVKAKISAITNFEPSYTLDVWKLNDASGNDLKDTDTFEADTTIFAVSKKVITVTLRGDSNVILSQTSTSVFEGSTWAEVKAKITGVTFKDGYTLDVWKLNDESGTNLSDDYIFNESATIYAVSREKKPIVITLAGDSNVNFLQTRIPVTEGSTWADVKTKISGVTFKDGYQLDVWKLNGANGAELQDTSKFDVATTIYAVSTPFTVTDGVIISCNDESLQTIVIPHKIHGKPVTAIGERAFAGCSDLAKVDLSKCINLTSIGGLAFKECWNLRTVDLSACTKLNSIGEKAFSSCHRLKSIDLSKCTELNSIGDEAFSSCHSLKSINLSKCTNLASIGEKAFDRCNSTKLFVATEAIKEKAKGKGILDDRIYFSIHEEGEFYFTDNTKTVLIGMVDTNAETAIVPASVTTIGRAAFAGCNNLRKVDLSKCTALTSIGEKAFSYCCKLNSVDFSACTKLTSIGNWAFFDCNELTSADLSACTNLASIEEFAFAGCNNLTKIDLSKCTNLTSIGESAFGGCTKAVITLPASITVIGGEAFGAESIEDSRCKEVKVPAAKKDLVTGEPCNYTGKVTEL
ncbi:leucine-rich repeat domain-containing protein [Treponema phagedenis]|uniref:Leucine-rich repeat domain-containing protein n=1 Tax=Treponema phagedenis TaxID=162 RepID=A0AAE6IRK0_TREPH|nr:leucine-rich repeat domain-containing protein [Treponema phagedenis]QEJ96734.1 leucine-rich repeat domain-containing protein [Treponema phagedenis]QEJ96805.1 leucine-rich repeat domain-containing protein [Treponema phagedenis]QEJ96894.1 leucine-rich repeat domain-containing protein [Treponema phagedenis]QEK02853.1 leucine-rich repeat domain-containing protein [Treponema phagedenis]QEK08481.1 leucine-rich repeat domain-containing protein [Treponema phagedenis]